MLDRLLVLNIDGTVLRRGKFVRRSFSRQKRNHPDDRPKKKAASHDWDQGELHLVDFGIDEAPLAVEASLRSNLIGVADKKVCSRGDPRNGHADKGLGLLFAMGKTSQEDKHYQDGHACHAPARRHHRDSEPYPLYRVILNAHGLKLLHMLHGFLRQDPVVARDLSLVVKEAVHPVADRLQVVPNGVEAVQQVLALGQNGLRGRLLIRHGGGTVFRQLKAIRLPLLLRLSRGGLPGPAFRAKCRTVLDLRSACVAIHGHSPKHIRLRRAAEQGRSAFECSGGEASMSRQKRSVNRQIGRYDSTIPPSQPQRGVTIELYELIQPSSEMVRM